MSIQSFIKRVCVQTAVYWEYKGPDGYGGVEYADPVEIACRWDDTAEVVSDRDGVEFVSQAEVLVTQDLKERSRVMLGKLSDLPVDPDPLNIEDSYEIKRMSRHPEFRSTTFDIFLMYV